MNGSAREVSVIIPTFNRKESLRRVLASLSRQTYPFESLEVIVVDDGSTDGTEEVARGEYPFVLRYLRQTNLGDIAARNLGAQQSQGDFLVFLDDDITVEATFICSLEKEHNRYSHALVVGTLRPPILDQHATVFQRICRDLTSNRDRPVLERAPFTESLSGCCSICRVDYTAVGMMQAISDSKRSVWCDVEFGYRVWRNGLEVTRSHTAVGYHNDPGLKNLSAYCRRTQDDSRIAVLLFQRHPEIVPYIPMFRDKSPVVWRKDPLALILRKVARQIASSRAALPFLEQIARLLEQSLPSPKLLRPLYRWIIGAYTFRGFRQGLKEYGRIPM